MEQAIYFIFDIILKLINALNFEIFPNSNITYLSFVIIVPIVIILIINGIKMGTRNGYNALRSYYAPQYETISTTWDNAKGSVTTKSTMTNNRTGETITSIRERSSRNPHNYIISQTLTRKQRVR